MGKPLRLLIVEDSEDDARLLLRDLRRAGYEVEFERVETAEALQSALTQKTWDLILSDYSLPEFNAPQALEILRASGLDLPFIIMSGTIGEDTAVAALKAGANDFLVKGKYARLGPAIERELREAETRRERRHAEDQLRYHARLLRHINDAVIATDDQLRITAWNRAAERMYGWSSEEVIGLNVSEILSDEQRAEAQEQLNESIAARGERIYHRKDGRTIHVETNTIALTDAQGKLTGYVSVDRDITERKRAEMQIQNQLQRLNGLRAIDTAISSSFDIRVTLDIVLQQVLAQLGVDVAAILMFDPHQQSLEYTASRGLPLDLLQQDTINLSDSHAGRAVRERLRVHIPNLSEANDPLSAALPAAQAGFVDYYGTPLIIKGEIKGVLETYQRAPLHPDADWLGLLEMLAGQAAIAIDNAQLFDNLRRANEELELRVARRTDELNQLNNELERANRTKDEFLATMSHELRTPLNSILGLSESLLEQRRAPLTEQQQKSLNIIASSGRHLLELINDILDLSKIEAGMLDYAPQIVGINELCQSSLAFILEAATRKSITTTYQPEENISSVYADPRRLKQILVNLLTNAVKFTPNNGQVTLKVTADMEQDRIQFSVIDNGIGIAPMDLQRVFVPFVQVDSSLTREYEGTGLGLALVQKLADLQLGSVDVESEVGKGSRFTVNLPLGQHSGVQEHIPASGRNASTSKLEGKSNISLQEQPDQRIILLAEDNLANILTIGDYLESHGYKIVTAHNGWEAIEKALEIPPNIILMDIQMPMMDGLEAIRRLRADPRFDRTPIIALTALAMSGDRESCLEAGANEYMSKPVSLKTLVKTISELLTQ